MNRFLGESRCAFVCRLSFLRPSRVVSSSVTCRPFVRRLLFFCPSHAAPSFSGIA
ncbi:hypothetical protein [uncultured Bacteroides sp.]|uniref:hypothetical protein n=1 Tax=uncultured Bacteroides sp. TaxID=162156 RepID=UPI002603E639|nr:hypothetical protein [uncultured Bacteroides sp.]